MHSTIDMAAVMPGFANPVLDAQRVSRCLLFALARPGLVQDLPGMGLCVPPATDLVAYAAFLALADHGTPIFLPVANEALASSLRFHTGSPILDHPDHAAFAYIGDWRDAPGLTDYPLGSVHAPEQAVTLFLSVSAFSDGADYRLSGPGIDDSILIAPSGLPEDFWTQRAAIASLCPRGVDCYLTCGSQLMGLPRTTVAEKI